MRSLLGKILSSAILVLAVVVLNFVLIHAAPGDPVETIAGESGGMSEALKTELRQQYGLDQPMVVQLGSYLGKVLTGDFGHSYYFNSPVSELILDRLGPTMLLVIASVLLAFVVGTWLGVQASKKPNGWLAQFTTVFSIAGFSAPIFWTGMMLIILFGSIWPILPTGDMTDSSSTATGLAALPDVLVHLILPSVTLALVYIAQYSRLSRASMIDVLGSDYVRTARAKGVSERVILYKHALRNAILPVITVLGLQFGNVLAGAVLVETVFNWPGLGRLAFDSVLRRDYPTILGILLLSSILVVIMNLITDFAYRLVDPRIKTS